MIEQDDDRYDATGHSNNRLMTSSAQSRSRTAVLACIVIATAIIVNGRVLKYPFIQDDWIRIQNVLTPHPIEALLREFSPFDKSEYRPFGALYFLMITRLFKSNPLLSHAIGLLLHTASSLLVVGVLRRITRDAA